MAEVLPEVCHATRASATRPRGWNVDVGSIAVRLSGLSEDEYRGHL
jgi:hypothetical protein